MPITTGSLTARLGQLLADISTFFATANGHLAAIRTSQDQLLSPTFVSGKTNLYLLTLLINDLGSKLDSIQTGGINRAISLTSILNAIGATTTDPSLRSSLKYLTQSGDGTPLNRNLQSVVDQVFDLQGTRPDEKTLYDVWVALQSPSGPRLQTIIEKLDILLDEKLGDPTSPLTAIGLLQLVQDCICELNEKTPPIEPPPPTPGLVPVESLCAAGLPLLWTITPSNWRQDAGGTWYAAPNTIEAAGVGYTLEDFDAGVGQGILELVVADMENINRLTECGVAVSLETGSLQTIVRQGYTITSRNPDEAIDTGLTSNADNVFNTASGCETIQLIGVEGVADAMRFEGVLRPGASFPPMETIWFYELPPN